MDRLEEVQLLEERIGTTAKAVAAALCTTGATKLSSKDRPLEVILALAAATVAAGGGPAAAKGGAGTGAGAAIEVSTVSSAKVAAFQY